MLIDALRLTGYSAAGAADGVTGVHRPQIHERWGTMSVFSPCDVAASQGVHGAPLAYRPRG